MVLKTKMNNLLGESLTHLDEEFKSSKKGILKVKDYLFTFLLDPYVPYDNSYKRGINKIKIKQKVSGCFRTDSGAEDIAKLHSISETAMKNGNPNSTPHSLSYNGKTTIHNRVLSSYVIHDKV